MKKITSFFLLSLCSICSIAQQVQVITVPSFDSKEKILYFTFNNTTDQKAWIHQSYTGGGTLVYITFLDKDNKEIDRRGSAYSNDRVLILQPKETKKVPISLAIFGYTNVAKVKIRYRVTCYVEDMPNEQRVVETVVFDWGE